MRCGQQDNAALCFNSIEIGSKICDHALWLQKGIVKGAGNVDEIAKQYMDSLA